MLNGVSWLYGKIIDSRNSLYSRGALKSTSLPSPTISVGNITVGGTGKTPLVAYLARMLADRGERVCVISRGYRRQNEATRVLVSDFERVHANPITAGDEPFELAKQLLRKAVVIADRNRISAAKWAKDRFGVTVFILDDAFQHRKVKRDLDIVVIDATNPFGNLRQLPSGILREDPKNLARADLIVVTRSNLCGDLKAVEDQIRHFAAEVPVFITKNKTVGFRRLSDFASGNDRRQGEIDEPAFAFCGIGNPNGFIIQLVRDDTNIVDSWTFRDHFSYTSADLVSIEEKAVSNGAKVLVTTAKDAVKINADDLRLPCFVCEITLSFQNEKGFAKLIGKAISNSELDPF